MERITFRQKAGLFFFGAFLSIILVEILLNLGGMVFLSIQEYRNWKSVKDHNTFRILCLGESTTAFEDGHSYPRQLESILNNKNLGVTFSVINKGVAGIYTEGILARLNDNLEKYQPEMVITMMGINDPLTEKKNYFIYLESFKVYKLISYLHESLTKRKRPYNSTIPSEDNYTIDPQEGNPTFLGVNSKSFEYYSAGEKYHSHGDLVRAKKMYELSIDADPRNHEAYAALAGYYIVQKEYVHAEEICMLNMKNNPHNIEVYDDLAEIYFLQERYDDLEKILLTALDINPFYVKSYIQLGEYNRRQGKYDAAEKILNQGLLKMPKIFHGDIYTELSLLYLSMGKFKEVEKIHKKALEVNPDNDQLYGRIGVYYLESGDEKTAEKYFAKADHIRQLHFNPETIINYQKLKNILAQKGIMHVAMQYPMRNVSMLKRILGNPNDILFVDNRQVFLQAIKEGSYDEYFSDKFGGDFGHCTAKGDRIIAENVANAIVNRYFKK